MLRGMSLGSVLAIVASLSLCCSAWADEKKPGEKPKAGTVVIYLDASKLPPGLLKQLLQYAEGPAEKKPEGKPKAAAEKKPEGKTKAEAKSDKTAPKPHVVQVDLNRLSPELRKRLEAELAKSQPQKDDDKRPGKAKKDDDDDDKRPGKGKKDDDQDRAKGRKEAGKERGKSKRDDDDDDDGKAKSKRGKAKDDD